MRSLLPILLLMSAALTPTSSTAARRAKVSAGPPDEVQVIEVSAKKYEFNPSPIHVKQGAHVQLKIKATDRDHGFKITEFPEGVDTKGQPGLVFSSPSDCHKLKKGEPETVEFVAKTPGTYPFRCCVHCGWSHRSMKGELIVEP